MTEQSSSSQTLTSAIRLFEVVECIQQEQPITVTELAEALDIPKSSTQVYLNTLYDQEYVCKTNGGYRLGLRFFEHGMNALRTFDIYPTVTPKVHEIAEETGELVGGFVEEHGLAVYVVAAGGENAIRTDLRIGSRTPMHCTAGGKAILANLPTDERHAIISRRGLPPFTKQTITEVDELELALSRIRDAGVAINREESIEGMHAVATPLWIQDRVVGALSISGPARRFSDTKMDDLSRYIQGIANEIDLTLQFDETVY